MNDKFIVQDATDIMVIGGFGNLQGNLKLLKYTEKEISIMIKENNNENETINLVNSLLKSIKELKEQLQQKEDVINKAKVDLEKHLNAKSYGNHKYELFDRTYLEEVLEILNNKGSNNE